MNNMAWAQGGWAVYGFEGFHAATWGEALSILV